jgi:hypothetical protein
MGCTHGNFCCTTVASTMRRAFLGVHELLNLINFILKHVACGIAAPSSCWCQSNLTPICEKLFLGGSEDLLVEAQPTTICKMKRCSWIKRVCMAFCESHLHPFLANLAVVALNND